MWLGTQNGLCRFDGKELKVYSHEAGVTHSLSDNYIQVLFLDRDDELWIGTQDGLNKYDKSLDRFIVYKSSTHGLAHNSVLSIEEAVGGLWLGLEDGLDFFDVAEEKAYAYNDHLDAAPNLIDRYIRKVYQGQNEYLWVGTNVGLSRMDLTSRDLHWENYSITSNNNDEYAAAVIYEDKFGDLWIGTNGYGLLKFNPYQNSVDNFFRWVR